MLTADQIREHTRERFKDMPLPDQEDMVKQILATHEWLEAEYGYLRALTIVDVLSKMMEDELRTAAGGTKPNGIVAEWLRRRILDDIVTFTKLSGDLKEAERATEAIMDTLGKFGVFEEIKVQESEAPPTEKKPRKKTTRQHVYHLLGLPVYKQYDLYMELGILKKGDTAFQSKNFDNVMMDRVKKAGKIDELFEKLQEDKYKPERD